MKFRGPDGKPTIKTLAIFREWHVDMTSALPQHLGWADLLNSSDPISYPNFLDWRYKFDKLVRSPRETQFAWLQESAEEHVGEPLCQTNRAKMARHRAICQPFLRDIRLF